MISKDNFKLSIIIPCYNEKKTIETILEKIINSLNSYKIFDYEIIIIDDFSNDGTAEILKNLKNKDKTNIHFHETNLGKGAAIQTAMQYINIDKLNFGILNYQVRILVVKLVERLKTVFYRSP